MMDAEKNDFCDFCYFAPVGPHILPDFPTHCLPPILKAYSEQIEESLQVVNQMIGPVLLGVASLCIRGEYKISPKADWEEPLNLYVLVINNPSEKKSPVLKEVLTPVYEYVDKVNKERGPVIKKDQLRKKVLYNQIEKALKSQGSRAVNTTIDKTEPGKRKIAKIAKIAGDLVTEEQILEMQDELADLEENGVKLLTLLADDFTTEALVKLLHENNEKIAVASAEGGMFGMMAGRYSSQPNLDIFLKGYSGEPYTSHRASGRTEMLSAPTVSLVLMIQPIVLAEALNNVEFRERGLMARFLYSRAGTKAGSRKFRTGPIAPEVRQAWRDLIRELLDISVQEWHHDRILTLGEEAENLAEAFFYQVEAMYQEYEEMEDWIGKFFGQTMRIAGVIHVIEHRLNSGNVEISAETMKNAIEIGRYFLAQADYVFRLSGLYDSPRVKDAKYILRRIDETGKVQLSKRDVYDKCKNKKGFETVNSEAFTGGLEELRDRGYIKLDSMKSGGRGRPTVMITLNPEYIKGREE